MKKIILMSVVITLFAITTTSCVLGFQSAKIKFKGNNPSDKSIASESKFTITADDDRFTMKEIKFTVSSGETKTSDETTVTWFGYNQEIKDAKFTLKISTSIPSFNLSETVESKIALKKDIKTGQLTEIELSNDNDTKKR